MVVELINTGSELMLGRVLNTHQQWLCRHLTDAGYIVSRQVTVPDTARAIQTALREALERADLVITTGGLGPTSDDLTREAIARMLNRTLREDASVLEQIAAHFNRRNRPVPPGTRVEAQVPEGAVVLPNYNGTAPGLAIEVPAGLFRGESAWLILLPGPPRELRPMFADLAMPLIRQRLPAPETFACRTLRTSGLGESLVQDRIQGLLREFVIAGLEVGYCARPGQVDVRLAARGSDAATLLSRAEATVRGSLAEYLYAEEEQTVEEILIERLTARAQTVCVAESCTGGLIADRLTNVPGASAVFPGGFVVYSNELKERLLGVSAAELKEHGAVSEPVARQMAENARRITHATFALAVTGIAGPGGGSSEKPVGTVFTALAAPDGTEVRRHLNAWDRRTFKEVTSQQALNWLRTRLMHI